MVKEQTFYNGQGCLALSAVVGVGCRLFVRGKLARPKKRKKLFVVVVALQLVVVL